MNRLHRVAGPAFLVVALALFIAFHLLPTFGSPGWQLWVEFWDLVVNEQDAIAPIVATFATFCAGVVASPFAIPLIRKSLLMRWFIAFLSALAFLGMFFLLLAEGPSKLGLGWICLNFAAGCNFAGIVLIPYEGRHKNALRKLSGN